MQKEHRSNRARESVRNSDHFNLDSILRDLVRQWLPILAALIAGAMLAGTYVRLTFVPMYTSSTTFVVRRSGITSNVIADSLSAAEVMTENLSIIIDSDILQTRVCRDLGLDYFDAEVSVSTVPSSNLMNVTVKATSPRLAYEGINSIMTISQVLCNEMLEDIYIQVIQSPSVPTVPSNFNNLSNTMKTGAVLGGVLALLAFALLSFSRDTIKTENEMTSKIDAKLLGSVSHERKYKTLAALLKRTRCSLCITNTTLSFNYTESVRMTSTRVRKAMDKENAKTVLITSVTENEGKSTVAANLALSLAQEGKKVLLLDCDFRKPAQFKIFEMSATAYRRSDLAFAIHKGTPIQPVPIGANKNLKVVFSYRSRGGVMTQVGLENLKALLECLKDSADYVVLDTAPMGLVAETEAIADLVDATVLVVEQDAVEACYINDAIDQLQQTSSTLLGCVYNNVRQGLTGYIKAYGAGYGYGYGYGHGHAYGYGNKYGNRYGNKYGKKYGKIEPETDEDKLTP